MTWTKIDDQFYLSLKNASIDRDEQDLYLASLVYCNGQLTNGFVPRAKLIQLYLWAKIPIEANVQANAEAIASRLVEHEFWEEAKGGWQVHDFLDWNPSKDDVLTLREARSKAGKVGGERSAAARQAKASKMPSKSSSKSEAKSNPVPVPVPVPINNEEKLELKGGIVPSPPASQSASYGREQAARLAQLNGQVAPALRTPLANAILDITGKRLLVDSGSPAGEKHLAAAHEAAAALYKMGITSETEILAFEPAWREDWRGKDGGSAAQFQEFVSERKTGITGRKNGTGRHAEQQSNQVKLAQVYAEMEAERTANGN